MTLSMAAAGQALAETVTPSGSGIPVAGAGPAAGALSVDGAVNQLVEAIKVGDSCWRASAPALAPMPATSAGGLGARPEEAADQQG